LKLFFIFPGKIKIFRQFAWKVEICLTWIHDPKISNQIDAAVQMSRCVSFAYWTYLIVSHTGRKRHSALQPHSERASTCGHRLLYSEFCNWRLCRLLHLFGSR